MVGAFAEDPDPPSLPQAAARRASQRGHGGSRRRRVVREPERTATRYWGPSPGVSTRQTTFCWLAVAWLIPRAVACFGRATVGLGLAGLAALQVWDTSAGWLPIRREHAVTGSAIPTSMQSDFWAVAARHYRKVRIVPAGNRSRGWGTPAPYRATNELAIDALYPARVDPRRLAVLDARVRE